MAQVLIIYSGHTKSGSTGTLASWIAQGAKKRNATILTYWLDGTSQPTIENVKNADVVILGSGVYNGDIEPSMAKFIDETLQAGNKDKPVDLSSRIGGVFCTSGGYATGAQPVLNSLSRFLMTFGAVIVGGGNWHTGQGVCGIVSDNKDGSWTWAPNQKYLQEDAESYGGRLANIGSFFTTSYNKAVGLPDNTGKIIKCNESSSQSSCVLWINIGIMVLLVIILTTSFIRI